MRQLLAAFIVLIAATFPALAQAPSPAVRKDLAPTGKLHAAINFGNPALAQRARTASRAASPPNWPPRSPRSSACRSTA